MTSYLLLFSIGGAEIFVIVLVIIIFFGSKKIPELARGIGKGVREFKNATADIQKEIRDNTSQIKSSVDIEKKVKDTIDDTINPKEKE